METNIGTTDIQHDAPSPVAVLSFSQSSCNIAVTFLLQAKSGFRVFVFVVALPHKGLVHRHQLTSQLPVILINSQPALTGEEVPAHTHTET